MNVYNLWVKWRNKTIYDEMDIHSYDTSNHVVCMCVLGWWSQQKVASEEPHKDAETCLPDDLISFSWHLYWFSGNIAQHNSQKWSPCGRPWPQGRPRGHILNTLALASKPQVLENCSVLGSRTALFLNR